MHRLVCLLPALALACATDALPDTASTSSEIINGTAITTDPAVVHISTVVDGTSGSGCSGSLISPRVVLTAGHCIDAGSIGSPITSQSVYFGTSLFADANRIEEIPVELRQQLPFTNTGDNDIALLLLEYDAVTEPMAINRSPPSTGQTLRLVGWGNTVGGDPGSGSGTKREAFATIESTAGGFIRYGGSGTGNTCQGDSGGPNFVNTANGEVVAGITSFGVFGCTGDSHSTRVDLAVNLSFIDNFIAQNDMPIAPVASFVSPTSGANVRSGFAVQVDASDNTSIDRVELWINGVLMANGTIPPYFFSTPALPNGQAILEARAYDNRGDVGTDSVTVSVDSSCNTDGDCGGNLICESDVCVDPEPPEGSLGDSCDVDADCLGGLCGISSDGNHCTQPCDVDMGDCPNGFECLDTGAMGVCWPDPDSGGCNVGNDRGGLATLLLVCLGLALFRRRRR